MQVSHNTIGDYASIFTSFRDNLQSLKGGKYTSSNISNLTETAGGIQFASWDDEVSTKLKSNRDELSGTILPKVSSSISNEFNTMCTLATNLCNEYSNYKSYNQTYYSIKSDETDEEKKETRRKAGINRESSLTKINGYLTELAKINFGGSSGSTGGTNGRGLNPNYVPEKPDYDAWNEGMYGDGYWNSDGTHNEKSTPAPTKTVDARGTEYSYSANGDFIVTKDGVTYHYTAYAQSSQITSQYPDVVYVCKENPNAVLARVAVMVDNGYGPHFSHYVWMTLDANSSQVRDAKSGNGLFDVSLEKHNTSLVYDGCEATVAFNEANR